MLPLGSAVRDRLLAQHQACIDAIVGARPDDARRLAPSTWTTRGSSGSTRAGDEGPAHRARATPPRASLNAPLRGRRPTRASTDLQRAAAARSACRARADRRGCRPAGRASGPARAGVPRGCAADHAVRLADVVTARGRKPAAAARGARRATGQDRRSATRWRRARRRAGSRTDADRQASSPQRCRRPGASKLRGTRKAGPFAPGRQHQPGRRRPWCRQRCRRPATPRRSRPSAAVAAAGVGGVPYRAAGEPQAQGSARASRRPGIGGRGERVGDAVDQVATAVAVDHPPPGA